MRKYFIGAVVSVIFVIYTFILRHQHSAPVIAPPSLSQNNSSSSTPNSTNSNNSVPPSTSNSTPATTKYKDGSYTGSVVNAFYGNVQVAVTIQSGSISAVNFLQSPNENPNSIYINQQAMPYLKQEAIQAQSPNVDIISGATYTSQAFIQSLTKALDRAMQS